MTSHILAELNTIHKGSIKSYKIVHKSLKERDLFTPSSIHRQLNPLTHPRFSSLISCDTKKSRDKRAAEISINTITPRAEKRCRGLNGQLISMVMGSQQLAALTATAFRDCTMIQWISSNNLLVTSFPRVLSRYRRKLLTVHLPPWIWL